jgi:hypothetical protein
MAAKDPRVRQLSARIAITERHHPGTDTSELRRDLRAALAEVYVRGLLDLPLDRRAHLARLMLTAGDVA